MVCAFCLRAACVSGAALFVRIESLITRGGSREAIAEVCNDGEALVRDALTVPK